MEIIPYVGAGDLRFGMSRDQIRAAIGYAPSSFLKDTEAQVEADAFEGHHIHVHYRSSGVCKAIEFFPPARVSYQAKIFFGPPFLEIRAWMGEIDPNIEIERSGLKSFQIGVALYAPAFKAPNEPVESVLIFERGYYDLNSTRQP